MSLEFRVRVLLSLQSALLGEVVPSLRAVGVSWGERDISARFMFDHHDDDHIELVQLAEGLVLGDFEDDVAVRFAHEVVAPPAPIDHRTAMQFVYMRAEADDGSPRR